MKKLTDLLNRLFFKEEINGGDLCPTYLYRWTLLKTRWFKVYLHHFVGDDWAVDPHDHPKRFISIGLKGSYWETTYSNPPTYGSDRFWKAPWIRSFPATHLHRIEASQTGGAWTLCIVGPQVREWGFWLYHDDRLLKRWCRWNEYVSYFGEERKDC